jgi:hypothetical protein
MSSPEGRQVQKSGASEGMPCPMSMSRRMESGRGCREVSGPRLIATKARSTDLICGRTVKMTWAEIVALYPLTHRGR